MSIQVDIKKKLGSFTLDVSLEAGNEALALLGASGCGKSLTLRCIAGIDTPDEGRIVVDGQVFFDSEKKIDLSPRQRRVGLLFQNYALFPNMTVEQNIAAGLREKENKAEKVAAYIRRFRLEELERRLPGQLSGGQQQRVALARMLISSPRVLMLDEPFSALDSHLRWEMEREVMGIIEDFPGTTLLVSHNRAEAYRICDQIAIYGSGTIDIQDEKWALFQDPRTYTAAQLTGCKNISPVIPSNGGQYEAADWGVCLSVPEGSRAAKFLGIRAHDLCPATGPGENTFPYEVVKAIEDTFSMILLIRPAGSNCPGLLRWELSREAYAALPPGGLVQIPKEKLLLLER